MLFGFWWISDKGKQYIEKRFQTFSPSELHKAGGGTAGDVSIDLILTDELQQILKTEFERIEQASHYQKTELRFVVDAIERFVPEYTNLRITRIPKAQMLVDKQDETLRLDQLSDGEKSIIALVGDIARRLSIANPRSRNPLHERGIVLIDEIDLHLHPSWQRMVVTKLSEVFPNCQFIVSTHSPQVISHVQARCTYLLQNLKETGVVASQPEQSFGMNSDRILEDVMEVDARPRTIKDKLHQIFLLIQNNDLSKAKEGITELQHEVGDFDELVKANVLIKRKELIGK